MKTLFRWLLLGNAINGTGANITAGATVALTPSGLTLNLEDSQSKADFVDRVNAGLKNLQSIPLLQVMHLLIQLLLLEQPPALLLTLQLLMASL